MTTRSDDALPPRTDDASKQSAPDTSAKPRVITLPAHLRQIPTCKGIPDRFNTYLLNIGFMLFFGTMFAGLLVAPFDDASSSRVGFIGFVLWLCILACLAWAVVIVIRATMNIGGWFQVDATGFRYGVGKHSDQAALQQERCIEWREVVRNEDMCCDVDFNPPSRVTMSPANFQFWRQSGKREPAKRYTLRTSLVDYDADDAIRCVRFKNRHELLVALLCGLAHQGLRFNPSAFIAAGIHPETWQPLAKARRPAMIYFAVVAALGLIAFWTWGRLSLPFSLAILLVSFAYYWTEGKYDFSPDIKHYPRDPIVFRIDGDTSAFNPES
ncbi:hypothetical protein [Burkholderia sp. Bp9004]|uniref:hypothetical protein n=1 Tax=Burkholderia sp. Bp9004 TaxID=2184559 RepID=UPI000F5D645D|nr:hypothetical protein [Burkholderia sp. Bp9004]RQZ69420.1 hypothetical protein DIE08_06570 [Burkholderia sp. Bp9004]